MSCLFDWLLLVSEEDLYMVQIFLTSQELPKVCCFLEACCSHVHCVQAQVNLCLLLPTNSYQQVLAAGRTHAAPDSSPSQWQLTNSRSKGAGQVICSGYCSRLLPAATFAEDTLTPPACAWLSPRSPSRTAVITLVDCLWPVVCRLRRLMALLP